MDHRGRILEVEGLEPDPDGSPRYVRMAEVTTGYFDALDSPILSGRGFRQADLERPRTAVVVNTPFVERVLGGADPVGRRIRLGRPDDDNPWLEIVGVVGRLGTNMVTLEGGEAVYLPVAGADLQPMQVAVRVSGDRDAAAPRLRRAAAEVDPGIVVSAPRRLDDIKQGDWYIAVAVAGGLAVLVLILVAMAASGTYAIISFAVSERTREIGVRTALGASRGDLLLAILRRAVLQIAAGAVLGLPLAVYVVLGMRTSGSATTAVGATVALAMGVVTLVGVASCLAPARRILAVEATEALRAEG